GSGQRGRLGRGGVRDVRRGGVVNHDVGGCLRQNVDLPAGGPCPPVGTRVHLRPGRGRSSSGSPCSTEEGTPGGEGGSAEHGPAVKSLYSHRLSSSLCEAAELEPHREHDKLLRVRKWLLVDLGVFLPRPRVPAHTSPKTQGPVSSVGGNGTLKNNRNFPGAFSIENTLHGRDVQLDRGNDLGVQANLNPVVTDRLDRVLDLDPALVQVRTTGGLHGLGDVRGRDRTEQAATLAGALLETHGERVDLALDLTCLLQSADVAGATGTLNEVDLLLAAPRPRNREPAGKQVVTAVTVLHLDDVAGGSESVDLVGQDQLHDKNLPRMFPASERCWCRAAERSHARS